MRAERGAMVGVPQGSISSHILPCSHPATLLSLRPNATSSPESTTSSGTESSSHRASSPHTYPQNSAPPET